MPDKEKVINGLEHCDFGVSDTCYEKECPYYQIHCCTDELKNDILALLKEQPEIVRCKDCNWGDPGECGGGIDCDGCWHDDDWFCADGERR